MTQLAKTVPKSEHGPFEERACSACRIKDRPEMDRAIRCVTRVLENEVDEVVGGVDLAVRAPLIDGEAFNVISCESLHRASRSLDDAAVAPPEQNSRTSQSLRFTS